MLSATLLLLGLGAGQADAQAIYLAPRVYAPPAPIYRAVPAGTPVPAYEVMTIVRSAGLAPLGAPVRRGAVYVLVAANRRHDVVRVIVDAWSGDILRIAPAGYAAQEAIPPGASGPPVPEPAPRAHADLDGMPPPVPPRRVPEARIAAPAAGLETPVPPLPRPRPRVASSEPGPAVAAAPEPAPRITGSIEAPVQMDPAAGSAAPARKPDLQLAPVVPLD
jgi:hypothetical protein